MLLDTFAALEQSVSLYRRMGFREIPPYYQNPHPGALYFRKDF